MGVKKIAILGASGQLGQSFQYLADAFPFELSCYDRSQLDITNKRSLEHLETDLVINCAAYTAVDLAEEEPREAYKINRDAVANIANVCVHKGIPLIHFSSDYVYHNNVRRPLRESDPTRPKGVYARSKLAGERKIVAICDQYLIFRVSWLYGPFGKNFPKTMLRLAETHDNLRIVNDQIGAPTNTIDLAKMILRLCVEQDGVWKHRRGIYNYCNTGHTSWAEMAQFIFSKTGQDVIVEPIPSVQYPTKAKRPRNSRLALSKFSKTFGIAIPDWQTSMMDCLRILKTNDDALALD